METIFTTRALGPGDEPFLWEMLYQALYVPAGQPPFSREVLAEPGIRRYVQGWGAEAGLGLLALLDDIPVGAAWLRLFDAQNPGYGYVAADIPEMSIALLPAYRGSGLGSVLLGRLFELARGRYAAISLSVSMQNPARQLYERLGFRPVSQSGDSLTMFKDLREE